MTNYSEIVNTFFGDEYFSPVEGMAETTIVIPPNVDPFDFIQNLNDSLAIEIQNWTTSFTAEFVLNSKKRVMFVVDYMRMI